MTVISTPGGTVPLVSRPVYLPDRPPTGSLIWPARLRRLLAVAARTEHTERRAEILARIGRALVADSLPFARNPITGRRTPLGILAPLCVLPVAVPLLLASAVGGVLVRDIEPYPGGVQTVGSVIETYRGTRSTNCRAEVEFAVDGTTYVVRPRVRSRAVCDLEGATVPVSYLPADPRSARALLPVKAEYTEKNNMDTSMGRILLALAAFAFLSLFTKLLVGAHLVLRSSTQRADLVVVRAPASPGPDPLDEKLLLAWRPSVKPPNEDRPPRRRRRKNSSPD